MSAALLQSIASNTWSILLIVLFFNGTIFVHEFGHFLTARRRGVKVERFSIGFGPKIFSWHGQDGVEYRLSWLPLGGYVLLPQLADLQMIEGESAAQLQKLPPVSYTTKMLVFFAGAACNMVFAFLLACVVWVVGQPTNAEFNTTKLGLVLSTITLPDGREVPSPASQAGFKPGDVVRAIDGKAVADWLELQQTLYASAGRDPDGRPMTVFTVERAGRIVKLTVYPLLAGDDRTRHIGIAPAEELVIGAVKPGLLGEKIGLRAGDRIMAYDSIPLLSRDEFVDHLNKHHTQTVRLDVRRGMQTLMLEVPPRPRRAGIADLGIQREPGFMVVHPGPVEQIRDNVVMTFRTLVALLNPRSDVRVSQLTGPVGIIGVFYATAQSDIRLVLWFTILLNVNLAILNLLPIPVLDGGHMLFATIGLLRGRSLPPDLIMTMQSVFFVLFFSLIIYLSFFDVRRLVRDAQTDQAAPAAAKTGPAPAAP